MATDARGHTVPTDAGVVDHTTDLVELSLSMNDPIIVTGTSDRTNKLSDLAASTPSVTPSSSQPIFFYRLDKAAGTELEYTENGTDFYTVDARDSGWQSVTLTGAFSGTVQERRLGKVISIRSNSVSGSFPVGTTAITGSGAVSWPPTVSSTGGAAFLSSKNVGVVIVSSAGTISIRHQSGATRTAAGFNITYLVDD